MQSRPPEDDLFDNDEDAPPPREFKLHMVKKFRDVRYPFLLIMCIFIG